MEVRRRVFRSGGWVALAAGVLTAALAATFAVIAVLALTGKATYPVKFDVGPWSVRAVAAMPVALDGPVCQRADISKQNSPRQCFRFFMHDQHEESAKGRFRHQDADIRPTSATLTGHAALATTGGWNPLVAVAAAQPVTGLAVFSAVLLLVWRLLATAAAGEAFSQRTVRHLVGIGWLLIGSALLAPALDHFASPSGFGYWTEAFGRAPHLMPMGSAGYPGGVDLAQLGLGALVLLVAEIFRHGVAIEAERRLTV